MSTRAKHLSAGSKKALIFWATTSPEGTSRGPDGLGSLYCTCAPALSASTGRGSSVLPHRGVPETLAPVDERRTRSPWARLCLLSAQACPKRPRPAQTWAMLCPLLGITEPKRRSRWRIFRPGKQLRRSRSENCMPWIFGLSFTFLHDCD